MAVLHALAALALAGCVGLAATPPADAPDGEARIRVDRPPGRYEFTAVYDGPHRDGLTYELAVVREGAAGRSRSSQGGAVRSDALSTSVVNVAPGDRVTARLTVNDGERIVAEDDVTEIVGGKER